MSKKLRETKQRSAITETLRSYGHPMTARHIRDCASKIVPSLGIATVYRNIRGLLDAGEIEQIDVPGATSYYGIPPARKHAMAVCQESQRMHLIPITTDLSANLLPALPKGFQPASFQLFILGRFTSEPD